MKRKTKPVFKANSHTHFTPLVSASHAQFGQSGFGYCSIDIGTVDGAGVHRNGMNA